MLQGNLLNFNGFLYYTILSYNMCYNYTIVSNRCIMSESVFYQYNPWWEDGYVFPKTIIRPRLETLLTPLVQDKSVVFLTGLRRVGKTTQLKLQIKSLLESGVNPKHIFYISLDDYLLREKNILDIIQDYRGIHRISNQTKVYLFLDEITYKEDFRIQLKNLYDQGHSKIFASSSSSSALKDTRGFLTGRERVIEVLPLDFSEYLLFKNITIKKSDKQIIKSYFEEYMQIGGMPEYVLNGNRDYLTSLVEDILYKDIVAAHGIRNPALIKDFFKLLMERAGKQVSINKLANILKISPDTASRYLYMFEEAYLIYLVPRYGKTNETVLSSKKIYAADIGIKNLFTGFRDKGAIFENIVYLKIKHLKPSYVYEDGVELDFITEKESLIEVKYDKTLNEKQQQLFDKISAKEKVVIQNFNELDNLDRIT